MPLINAGVFLATCQSYRLVWISGRFGGGKTSVAFKIAETFLMRGYRLITNNNCVWSDPLEGVELTKDGHLKSIVVLDEGGLYMKVSAQMEMVASYAAKMDCIYLIPSFWPPTKAAQVLIVQPVFNFKSAGIPVIVYKWRVKIGAFADGGWFAWQNPGEIYGIYSRQDPGDTGTEIIEFLVHRTGQFRDFYGRSNQLSDMAEVTEADRLTDAVSSLAEAADTWSSVSVRKSSRRRF